MVEKLPRSAASSRCAASRSGIEAAVTTTVSSRPFTSTAMCRLTPFVFLPPSQPRLDRARCRRAGSVCASMIAADGQRSRPARTRGRSRSASRMRCHAPLRAQPANTAYIVAAGGNSIGSCRHGIPPPAMYRMASTIARRQCFSGRPPRAAVLPGAGNSGSRIAHYASVTDDEYTAQPCPPTRWGGHDGHGEIGDDGIAGLLIGAATWESPTQPGANFFGSPRGTRPPIAVLKHSLSGLDPRLVNTRSGGLCRLSESVFEADQADHSEGRMASASVVDSLDPVADAELGGCLGRPQVPVVELDFQYGPK